MFSLNRPTFSTITGNSSSQSLMEMRIIVCAIILIRIHHDQVDGWLQMLSSGRVVTASHGETVHLDCEFQTNSFNLFDNPLLWQKMQFKDELFQMNMMGNILQPFAATRRFRIKFTKTPPVYSLQLTITDVEQVDNGNYTCRINGPENTLLGLSQHALIVTASVDAVLITTSNISFDSNTINSNNSDKHHSNGSSFDSPKSFVFADSGLRPSSLACAVFGGYPPPDVLIQLGQRDVTDYFRLIRTSRLAGVEGLESKYHTTVLVNNNFRLNADDDGKQFKCIASTQGVATNVSAIRIIVQYAPVVRCDPRSVSENEVNVILTCDVRSRPRPSMYWIVDSIGTKVSEEQDTKDAYAFLTEHKKGVFESQLILRRVRQNNFRSYVFVAENIVGKTSVQVELTQTQNVRSSSRTLVGSSGTGQSSPVKDRRLEYAKSSFRNPASMTSSFLILCALMTSSVAIFFFM